MRTNFNENDDFMSIYCTGAYGTFRVTDDVTDLTCIKALSAVGKETKLFCRFSSSNIRNAPDATFVITWSMKLYTEDGNWDILTRTRLFSY